MKKNITNDKTVYNFTALTKMKFKSPEKHSNSQIKPPSVLTKIKSLSWMSKKKDQSKISNNSQISNTQGNTKGSPMPNPLQYIKKLTNEHFLVGNQFRIDVIYLGSIVEDFIDTEYMWSLKFNQEILNIAVDTKKYFLAFLFSNEVKIYIYNLKKSKDAPQQLTVIKTTGQVKFIQFAKDAFLTIFYQTYFEIYAIDDSTKIAKKKTNKLYNQPQKATIFQVPQAHQGVINIFFEQSKQLTGLFQIWNVEVKIEKQQIVMSPPVKIYDISNKLRNKVVFTNYNRDIFFMNLGQSISAIKKGYIIDTVNSNIQSQDAVLRYLGNDRLVHVTTQKIQLYKCFINTQLNPPRIILSSTDSIYSKMNDSSYSFLDVIQMLNQNIVVFYQISFQKNNSLSGEIKYAFTVTQKVKFQQKVRSILPSSQDLQMLKSKNKDKSISQQDYQMIQQKCDMAMKMGLTRKQIYLILWNNSTKCDISDFQFLLDTMNYSTIREQIQTKLKKKSMVLREVIKIEQGCISMLQKTVFSPSVTQQELKNFLISHLLLRKLKLYQMFHLIQRADSKLRKSRITNNQSSASNTQNPQDQAIMINIKDYVSYSKCDLKQLLLELVRDFCFNQKDTVLKIRTFIKLFKFSFRPIYSSLLEDIIKQAGNKLLVLLEAIPQFLPYAHTFQEEPADTVLYEGIWGNILPQQWEANLYASGISTIDNKDAVSQMVNSVWSKRFFLTLHDLLPYSKNQILQIHERNKAEQTFYNFIQKIFNYISQKTVLQELVNFIQLKYESLPRHLVGQIFLYRALFQYLTRQKALKSQSNQFNKFLKLKDFQICKHIFDLQKRKKNCILKDVKENIFNSKQFKVISGNDLFNLMLLNFFSSELSQISDIKYLLNRLNNQKYEFHSENQGMYQVIVKGMQAKLYLGGKKDIPIDQVFIYISNIHIESDSQIKKDLKYLQLINKHCKKFKQIKLNMSVFQMIRQVQKVLTSLLRYDIQTSQHLKLPADPNTSSSTIQEITAQSLKILSYTQSIRQQIFFQSQIRKQSILFIFFTIILEQQKFIQKAKQFLQSQAVKKRYQVNELFVQNIVLFMYKKRFSQDKVYRNNQTYIKQLLILLPQQNKIKTFISNQIQLALTLSCEGNLLQYPLGGANGILSTIELQSAINFLPGQALNKIDLERLYQISSKMQQISSDGQISSITLNQIYEIMILRLLQCKKIHSCIPIIRKIIQLNPLSQYNFIYPVLLIKKFSSQLCDQNRSIILKILRYQYENPNQLLDIVQKLLNNKYTSLEQKIVLNQFFNKIQKVNKVFNKFSQIFNQEYIELLEGENQEKGFGRLLTKSLEKILSTKDQFVRNPQYPIIYTILCNNPYSIVKYLYCSRYQSNFKGIRCFFSHLIKQQLFNRSFILQLGKRIFKILFDGLSQTIYIQSTIQKYKSISLSTNLDIKKIKPDSNLAVVMSKSIQRFKNKIKEDANNINKKKKNVEQTNEERKTRIKERILKASELAVLPAQQISNQYPFQDSDNQLGGHQTKLKKIMTNQSTNVQFDPTFQTQLMTSRMDRKIGMYLSQQFGTRQKQLFYSKRFQQLQIKNSVVRLKNKKKQIQNDYSLRISVRKNQIQDQNNIANHLKSPMISVNSPIKKVMSFDLTQSIRHDKIQPHFSIKKFDQAEIKPISQQAYPNQDFLTNQKNIIQPQIDILNQPAQTPHLNYELIISKILQKSSQQNFDLSPINETTFQREQQFEEFLNVLYNSENKLTIGQSLSIIKKLAQKPNPHNINNDFLDIYIKMQNFQKKFNLQIELRTILPISGIFLKSKSTNDLFSYVKDKIIQILTQNNVYKISKVMALVFKNNQIEQELNISYLVKFLKQFQTSRIEDSKELAMQREKIKAFTQKISIFQLNSKDQQILNAIKTQELKNFMIQAIGQAMKKKKNQDMAANFVKKWKG